MILALDTATSFVSLALHDGNAIIAEASWRSRDHHTVELAPALDDVFRRVGLTPADLKAVAVALGPGSFTGLRIGLALAKGLALAANPPLSLIGVPTLDIVAVAQPHLAPRLCAVAQAGRGRINAGFYLWAGSRWQAEGDVFLATWPELAERLDGPAQVGGEIDAAGREVLASMAGRIILSPVAHWLRRAGFLADLAWERLTAGKVDNPATLAPIYLNP